MKASAQLDKNIHREIDNALADQQNKSSAEQLSMWRIIMKMKTVRFATAAIIILAVIAGLNQFGIPVDGAKTAFAVQDVVGAMNQVKCIHTVIEFEDGVSPNEKERSKKLHMQEHGSEYWETVAPAISVYKSADGTITFADYETGETNRYNPKTNIIEVNTQASLAQPTHMNIADKYLKKVERQIGFGAKAEYNDTIIDGETVTLVKVSNCSMGTPNEVLMMYVNPHTLLPIKLYWTTSEPGGSKYWFIFDYPDTFPKDIYQAGAPKDAIIKNIIVNNEFLDLLVELNELNKKSINKLPRQYVAIEVQSGTNISSYPVNGISYVKVFYHNDDVYREDYIRYNNKRSDSGNNTPNDIHLLENTFESQFQFWLSEDIEKYNYERNKIVMGNKKTGEFITLIPDDKSSTGWKIANKRSVSNDKLFDYRVAMNSPLRKSFGHGFATSSIFPYTKSRKVIEDSYSKANNLVCVEVLTSGYMHGPTEQVYLPSRELSYLDPTINYMCMKMIRIKTKQACWHDDQNWLNQGSYRSPREGYRLWEVVELGQTDSGLIYVKEQAYDGSYFDMRDETCRNHPESIVIENPLTTSIYLAEDPEFPEGIFDSKKLSE